MAAERLARILALVAATGTEAGPDALCRIVEEVLEVDGAGILLLSNAALRSSAGSTNAVMRLLHDLQLDLGEGPAMDSHRKGAPVLEADLLVAGAARWPVFGPAAVKAGALSMFCVPLRTGAVRVGALSCWRERSDGLTDDQHADLLVFGEVATRLVLDFTLGEVSDGVSAVEEVEFDAVVHQAVGMVAVQLEVPLDTALLRLRAHAFSGGRTVREVAADVLARRLRLDADADGGGPSR